MVQIVEAPMTGPHILTVLSVFLMIGVSVLVGWIITKIMEGKGYKTNLAINLCLCGLISMGLLFRYGPSVTAMQGVFLMLVLLWASWSDLTSHTMDDYLWVLVFALALPSIQTVGLGSMLIGAFAVFLPQFAMTFIPNCKALGGADIKMSTALAFLLGWQRGLIAFAAGLLAAVIVMAIYNKAKQRCNKKPFALIPFLSGAAVVLFFI